MSGGKDIIDGLPDAVTTTAKNTDRELWRERDGDYYAASIHVTADGAIGIDVAGHVVVKPIREWHSVFSWRCKAGSLPSGDIQDCDWPNCGCDPHVDRVIEDLVEQGWASESEVRQKDQRVAELESLLREAEAFCPRNPPEKEPLLGNRIEQVLANTGASDV